ncbi:MAG: bifunctional diaminohydroxyphosphoribosylaminopyrimidine deaminase/5-amino-6-(5-phosphoribosylamino)uracil reductase RibD [Planctomycetia bacterium]|nr:bifunctional diaminohydroxyphosphoribosylaminopyrimidine deaminase/5-amino-6-(5-phosphoribosylamino)uracil reductase RibD [Planctomycetia bacterium]
MAHALRLAARGQGSVEPNPMVGAIVAHGAEIVGEGWHRRFGGDHAEIEALKVAGPRAKAATLYVTLEPCCHQGKTPPCTRAILAAGASRLVVARQDPYPPVAGKGIAELRAAGIVVDVGVLEAEAGDLLAPYLKLVQSGRPWVIAKWAMTLDGKLAARTGDSRWISGEESRAMAHALRGRVDAVIVGSRTAAADDPLLTARPPGPRTPLRIVVDSRASLATGSQLARTAREVPVLVAVGPDAAAGDRSRLQAAGCEVLSCGAREPARRIDQLLDHLGARHLTNVLVEGGGTLLGAFFDGGHVDEVHVFVAPRILGGAGAVSVGGRGSVEIAQALALGNVSWQRTGDDLYLHGRVHRRPPAP